MFVTIGFWAWAKTQGIPSVNVVSDGTTTNDQRLGAVADIQFGLEHFELMHDLLVIGGDTLMLPSFDLADFINVFKKGRDCLVTTYTVPDKDVHKVGIVETDSEGRIKGFIEKPPRPSDTVSRQACPCFYLFHRDALPHIADFLNHCKAQKVPLEAYDATGKCLAYLHPLYDIAVYPITGRIDVGGLTSYLEADELLKQTVTHWCICSGTRLHHG